MFLRRVDEKITFQCFAPKQDATDHTFTTDEAELDLLGSAVDNNCGAYKIALMLLPIARSDMGLVVNGRDDGFSAGAVFSIQHDIELNSVPRKLDDIPNIERGATRPGITLSNDRLDTPIR